VTLAVQTGIHWRAWLDDPVAMFTAAEVLSEMGEQIHNAGR
jgi:hypothetical protein